MSLYAADGSWNVTVVDGSTRVGVQASDGSYNVVDASAETDPVGVYHASGALNVTPTTDPVDGRYAANGSLYVSESEADTGAQFITIVDGAF